jgi:hypothetical protein
MAKVYVSSTIVDLEQERQAVMEWLVAARHQPVHSYLPSSETVRDSVLDDVDACDLYVLIFGYRGMRPGPATSSPPCCPSASGSWAPSTPTP